MRTPVTRFPAAIANLAPAVLPAARSCRQSSRIRVMDDVHKLVSILARG
jgi:hypothetical protein